jgi:hypothetical protein
LPAVDDRFGEGEGPVEEALGPGGLAVGERVPDGGELDAAGGRIGELLDVVGRPMPQLVRSFRSPADGQRRGDR